LWQFSLLGDYVFYAAYASVMLDGNQPFLNSHTTRMGVRPGVGIFDAATSAAMDTLRWRNVL
jgi:hypothetical protein